MYHLRQRVGYSTRADIVYRQYRIRIRQRTAAINHFLRAALNFRIAALHRIEIEVFLIRAGIHAGRRTAAKSDQHARPTQLNQQRARAEFSLERMARGNIADATGYHDRLVVAAHLAGNLLFVGAKVTRKIGPPKLVVKRRPTNRAFEHDLQCRCDASRFAV